MQKVTDYIQSMDIRKVAFIIGFLTMLEQGIVDGKVVLAGVPELWMPAIKAWCSNFIYLNGLILMGHTATAAKWPEPPPAVVKAVTIFAVLITALIFAMPAMAQVTPLPLKKPPLTGNPVKDFQAATGKAMPAPAAVSPTGDPLADFMAKLEKINADFVSGVIADIQLADNDAATIITPAVPPVAAVPANPNATPPTPAILATDGVPAVVKDPISHACYPAAVRFLGSIPAVAKPTGKFTGVQLFQAKRDFIAQLQAGLPNYLKLGCAPLLGDEINIAVEVFNMIGIKVAPAALTAIMPALAPITLPAMVLAP